jgi:hypothetical protein
MKEFTPSMFEEYIGNETPIMRVDDALDLTVGKVPKYRIIMTKEWNPRNAKQGTRANRIVLVVWYDQETGEIDKFSTHKQIIHDQTGSIFLDGGHYEYLKNGAGFEHAYHEFLRRY